MMIKNYDSYLLGVAWLAGYQATQSRRQICKKFVLPCLSPDSWLRVKLDGQLMLEGYCSDLKQCLKSFKKLIFNYSVNLGNKEYFVIQISKNRW